MRAWLDAADIADGPVFRRIRKNNRIGEEPLNAESVVEIIKDFAERAGFPPEDFAGHSLRSGFITSAARAGVAERHIQDQSGHRSLPVLRGYIRRGSLFADTAAAKVGL